MNFATSSRKMHVVGICNTDPDNMCKWNLINDPFCSSSTLGQFRMAQTLFLPTNTHWEIKGMSISSHVYVVWDTKEPLQCHWNGGRVSVYLIIIACLYIAINELQRDVEQNSVNQLCRWTSMRPTDEIKIFRAQAESCYILLIHTLRNPSKVFTPIVIKPTLSFWLQLLLISLQMSIILHKQWHPHPYKSYTHKL